MSRREEERVVRTFREGSPDFFRLNATPGNWVFEKWNKIKIWELNTCVVYGVLCHDVCHPVELVRRRVPHCPHPGWGAVEELLHRDLGASVGGGGRGGGQRPAVAVLAAVAAGVLRRLGHHLQGAGHVRDGGQRLPPEPVGGDGLQVGELPQLGGGEALAEDGEVLPADPAAVVADLHHVQPAPVHRDGDVGGAGVQGVLHHLLEGVAGALDDLAGSDPGTVNKDDKRTAYPW